MVEQPRDFDDWRDDEPRRPLLPPEDRVWRHPSELGSEILADRDLQVMAARRRWLASTPSRAGAGTAGIVGALLATGVVLVGTHLSSWIPHTSGHPSAHQAPGPVTAVADVTTTTVPAISSAVIAPMVASIEAAVVRVNATGDNGTRHADGVVVSQNGYVVVPAAALAGAESISIVRSDGEELIAHLAGRDPATGIAVLHVEEAGLPSLAMSQARSLAVPSLMLVATWAGRFGVGIAALRTSPGTASLGTGPALLETSPPSLQLGSAPLGSVILNADGQVTGMVVTHEGKRVIATPGWVIGRVTSLLVADGRVAHGWLGIDGTSTHVLVEPRLSRMKPHPGRSLLAAADAAEVPGVRVVRVESKSAAARAGLRSGDVIESINGKPVTSMSDLQAVLYLMAPSTAVRLEVVRDDHASQVRARLLPAA